MTRSCPADHAAYLQIAMAYAAMGAEAPAEPRTRYRAADMLCGSCRKVRRQGRMSTPWNDKKPD